MSLTWSQLFSALSDTLHGQLRTVTNEKHEMTEEAHRLIKTIKQMEASMHDNKTSPKYNNDEPQVTYPLTRCLKALKDKYNAVAKQHQVRFEQVRSRSSLLLLHG